MAEEDEDAAVAADGEVGDGVAVEVAPPGDDRIFVVEKGGRIRVYADGRVLARPFLDISDRVVNSGEMGLLSMAFHPDWPADDRVFVYYSTRDADGGLQSQVSSFR